MGPQPTLTTARLVLRPFLPTDAPAVERLAGAFEVADTTLNIPHPYEAGMGVAWIRGHQDAWSRGLQATFAIAETALGLVGAVGLRIEASHQRAELGYWVAVPYWGRGFATEAARAVVELGFGDLGRRRIYATHLTRNPASGRVMQKLGMSLEGTKRQHVLKWDRFEDLTMYGLLRDERSTPAPQPASDGAT